jgi:O-antigen ligase/tetratricopeptide (TPR) repeat protein
VGLSYFYSINNIEALVNIPRHLNTLLMYLFIGIFIFNIKEKNLLLSWLISIILFIETYAVLTNAFEMINASGMIEPVLLKGITANRNITAFSIALKIPFVLYLTHRIKNKKLFTVLIFLLFLSFLDLTLIQSRASYIAVLVITIGYVLSLVYKFLILKDDKKVFINLFYFFIPIVLAIIINQTYFSSKIETDAIQRATTISIKTTDDSISKRLRYYEDVLTHMLDNPIFGTGIGNWKFESIKYDRLQIDGYIVPYHAHSDFIQLGAELGFIGFFLYVFIFICAIYFVYYILFKSKIEIQNKLFSFFLIISLGVYLIDANLNFPIARPQELAPMALVLALINYYFINSKPTLKNHIKMSPFIKAGFPIVALILLIPSLFITQKTYSSQISQMVILSDFNADQYNIPLNQIETFIPSFPNVTVTTIPMDAIKARYYFHYQKYEKALEYAEKSELANPYLGYGSIVASRIYNKKGKYAKAQLAAKKAFIGMPNNSLHIGEYLKIILEQKDNDALENAYPILTSSNKITGWKSYLVAKSALTQPGDPIFINRAEKAQKLFPFDDEFRKLVKTAKIGNSRIDQAYNISQQAQIKYTEQSFEEAAILYDRSIELDPYEYSYFENAALSYYGTNNLDSALSRINTVVDEMNPLNGKCEYIKGLIYLKLGVVNDACELFETSVASGFGVAQEIQKQYCNK